MEHPQRHGVVANDRPTAEMQADHLVGLQVDDRRARVPPSVEQSCFEGGNLAEYVTARPGCRRLTL